MVICTPSASDLWPDSLSSQLQTICRLARQQHLSCERRPWPSHPHRQGYASRETRLVKPGDTCVFLVQPCAGGVTRGFDAVPCRRISSPSMLSVGHKSGPHQNRVKIAFLLRRIARE